MKLQYLGTSAAEGFPAVFCNCEFCRAARRDLAREQRSRSQMLIDGQLLVDFPPDAYLHAVRFGVDLSAVRALLVTHSHTDHFYAQEFVNRGYKFASGMAVPDLDIYGNEEVAAVYAEGVRREMRGEVGEHIRFHVVHAFEKRRVGPYEVLSFPASHTPKEEALLYCVRGDKTVLYCNDTGLPAEECYRFLAENGVHADLVSMDCTQVDRGGSGRHMGLEQNAALRDKLLEYGISDGKTKYYVTHFSHNSAPLRDRIDKLAAGYGFCAAYDGLTVEL